jgi:CheY-like chemotaxis protein
MSYPDRKSTLILGVDDNPTNLKVLRVILETAGYSFVAAESGLACLDLLWRVQPKVILLDVKMPGLNGIETCRRIHAQLPHITAPILFLTASNTSEDLSAALEAGGDDFIIKPFAREKLLDRITAWSRKGRSAVVKAVVTPAEHQLS